MTNTKKSFGIIMTTLMSASFFTACSPQGLPTMSQGSPQMSQTQLSQDRNQAQPQQASIQQNSTTQNMQDSLVALHDEEALYNDSLTIAQDDGGFSTQMLDAAPLKAQVSASLAQQRLQQQPPRPAVKRKINKNAKQALKARFEMKQEQVQRFKMRAKAASAIKFENKRIIIIDKKAFKQGVKEDLKDKKDKFERHLRKHKAQLKIKKQLAKAQLKKLKRQNMIVRTSDKITTENEDGSITETLKIHFENPRIGLTRDITLAKTMLNGKAVSIEFDLKATAKHYTRSAHRVVTFNEDGSKHVVSESVTEWKNGKKREVQQERLLNADGSGSGTGTVTLTLPDGTIKTHQISTNIDTDGALSSDATSEEGEEVILEENAEGEATVVVDEGDGEEPTEEAVDIEEEAEEEASGEQSADEAASDENGGDTEENASDENTTDEGTDETSNDDGNNGHGNDEGGVDDSNPGNSEGVNENSANAA